MFGRWLGNVIHQTWWDASRHHRHAVPMGNSNSAIDSGFIVMLSPGAVGAVSRHAANELCRRLLESKLGRFWPLSTLLVNVLGCFAIGLLMALVRKGEQSDEWRRRCSTRLEMTDLAARPY